MIYYILSGVTVALFIAGYRLIKQARRYRPGNKDHLFYKNRYNAEKP